MNLFNICLCNINISVLVIFFMISNNIPIHISKNDYEGMRKAGSLAAQILDELKEIIRPGISTKEINDFCEKIIKKNNAIAAPKDYVVSTHKDPFPESICTSINDVVCHGIPNEKTLKDGDIINVDITIILDGWHGDSSRMYVAGKTKYSKVDLLLKTTYECLLKGIKVAKPGNTFGDIGYVIQKYAESKKFSIVRNFTGHGIGKKFHSPPQVLHFAGQNRKIHRVAQKLQRFW